MDRSLRFFLQLFFLAALTYVLFYIFFPNALDDKFVTKESKYTVGETMGRLQAILHDEGFLIIDHIDHEEMAHAVNMELKPTQVLFFGKPTFGTPLIEENRAVALMLPLKVMVWEDRGGKVLLGYINPVYMGSLFNISKEEDVLAAMADELDVVTDRVAL